MGGALVRSLRRHLHGASAAEPAVARALACSDEGGDSRHVLGAAECLHVLVEHLVDRGAAPRRHQDIVGVERRLTVDHVERRCRGRSVAAAVTGPAGDHLAAAEVVPVDRGNHLHHAARGSLPRRVECPVHVVGPGRRVAANAVRSDGSRHDSHGQHEVVHGQTLQCLHVLERLVHGRRLGGRRLAVLRRHQPARTRQRREDDERGRGCQLP